MKKVKIGLIGAGSIARTHLKAYAKLDNAEVVAVCDIDPANLKKTCDRFGIPEEHRYYYYVVDTNAVNSSGEVIGKHIFSKTLAEHNNAIANLKK